MKCYLGLVDEDEVQEDYDLYIWFGHHCEKGIEWCQNNKKEYQIIDNDWGDNKYTQEVYNYLQEVKRSILEYISRMLNDYHDAEISKDGWVVFLSYWLDLFVTSA